MINRKSGIELLRVFCIFAIIAHHYYVHGLLDHIEILSYTEKIFFQCASMFGRSACSIFVIISGFFMVEKNIPPKRIMPLYLEMLTYSVLFMGFAYVYDGGVNQFDVFAAFFPIPYGNWFCVNYVFLILIAPFLNKILLALSVKEFKYLMVILFVIYSLITMFSLNSIKFSDLDFFLVMYTLGGFLKLHGKQFLNQMGEKKVFVGTFCLMLFSVISIDLLAILLNKKAFADHALFFQNANSFLSIAFAISAFAFFLKLNFHNSFVNYISKSVLGIYLIHDNHFLRSVIWNDWFPFASGMNPFVHFFVKICVVFLFCLVLDIIRRESIERLYRKK